MEKHSQIAQVEWGWHKNSLEDRRNHWILKAIMLPKELPGSILRSQTFYRHQLINPHKSLGRQSVYCTIYKICSYGTGNEKRCKGKQRREEEYRKQQQSGKITLPLRETTATKKTQRYCTAKMSSEFLKKSIGEKL